MSEDLMAFVLEKGMLSPVVTPPQTVQRYSFTKSEQRGSILVGLIKSIGWTLHFFARPVPPRWEASCPSVRSDV